MRIYIRPLRTVVIPSTIAKSLFAIECVYNVLRYKVYKETRALQNHRIKAFGKYIY